MSATRLGCTVHLGRVPALTRRGVLLAGEIAVVPSLLLYSFVAADQAMPGLVAVFVWRTGCMVARLAVGLVVPATVWLAFGLFSARTIGGLAASSVSLYLVVPVVISAGQGAVFLGSALAGRPLMARLLRDFASDIPDHPTLRRLLAQLSGWWGGVHLCCALIGVWAVTLPPMQAVAVTGSLGLVCTVASVGGCALWASWRLPRTPELRIRFADLPATTPVTG